MHFHHVRSRNSFRDADDQRQLGVGRFHDGVGRERGRHEYDTGVRASLLHRFRNRVEHRSIQMLGAALPGSDATDDLRAISNRLLCVESALSSSEALKDQSCVFVDKYAHCASLTTFSAASFMPSATVKFKPESLRICWPNSTLVPSIRPTTGILISSSR